MSLGIQRQMYNSTYTGTGAAKTLTFGFKPVEVTFYNITDGDSIAYHIQGMDDGTAIVMVGAPATVATEGVTLTATGCTLGTDVSVNETDKVFRVVAK